MCMHVCAAMGTLFGLSVFSIFSTANSVSPTLQIRDYDVVSVAGISRSPKVQEFSCEVEWSLTEGLWLPSAI